jgi:hypothetical protein
MKIRSGFVSNSSSSSFIVGFPKMPTSPEALEISMFGAPCEVNYYDIHNTPSIEIARTVFNEIQTGTAKRLTKRSAVKVLLEGGFPGDPPYDYNKFKDKESDKIRRAYKEETGKDIYDDAGDKKIQKLYHKVSQAEYAEEARVRKIAANAFIEGFWPRVRRHKVFRFEYADDGGMGVYEHGDIFHNFPHVQISKH